MSEQREVEDFVAVSVGFTSVELYEVLDFFERDETLARAVELLTEERYLKVQSFFDKLHTADAQINESLGDNSSE